MASNGEFRRFVVDASVAAKWVLKDEPDTHSAETLLADFRESRIQLIAPEQISYEVPSAVRNAVRSRRMTVDQARTAIEIFLALNIETVRGPDLILAGYELAVQYGSSLYDGLYLALAEAAACPLVFADARLRNTLGDRFPPALWLTAYAPARGGG
jgi:predicted nucleic acid-binding protein